ncbi:unnamed protein product [Effrenium voratum]|nr:unnamed protein product [Effrenium voratum]
MSERVIRSPWEWDFTNKRKYKLTTKQLRRMFTPRTNSCSRRTTPRGTDDFLEESINDFEFEEVNSFASEEDRQWIDEA